MSKEKRLDKLGDRMKAFERIETDQKFRPNSWLYVRIDGRSFSKFTKGLKRPYDQGMSMLMIETTKYLVDQFNCLVGYSQSDEISLLLYNGYESSCVFDGKKQKLISTLAATASAFFNSKLHQYLPEKVDYSRVPTFDCRIFEVPDASEAMNAFYWRELDCVKNSISMAAHDKFSHKELHKKNAADMKDMLLNCKGISWDEFPDFFKYGTYCKRITYFKSVLDESIGIVNKVQRHKVDTTSNHLCKIELTDDRINFITSKSIIED